jgi:hypothetical protein
MAQAIEKKWAQHRGVETICAAGRAVGEAALQIALVAVEQAPLLQKAQQHQPMEHKLHIPTARGRVGKAAD